ncbi:MAG: sigma-54 dependent transcriptional regulator, partial [bacterium]
MNGSVLVVDDKENVRKLLSAQLREDGFDVDAAAGGEEALEMFAERAYDVVITDMRMPGMTGLEVIGRVREISPDTAVLVITAFADVDNAIAAMKAGAADYLKKPFKLEEIRAAVEKAMQAGRLMRENRLLRAEIEKKYSFANIIADSDGMREVFARIGKIAGADSTVLITGETGTGKELVARAIHRNSRRAHAPFVVVDCASIPPTLLESEMFGHRRGAFTGAVYTKRGMFEAADGGTLFLDEVGELSPPLQGKLLRALQDGGICRVGDTETRHVDVRVIAATNKDLEREVAAENFRKDLFFRIN